MLSGERGLLNEHGTSRIRAWLLIGSACCFHGSSIGPVAVAAQFRTAFKSDAL
jgi:hypothetical protein